MKSLPCLLAALATTAVLLGVGRAEDQREEKPRFKGVELYSWKDDNGEWTFVLLNGTNALKTKKAVKEDKDRIQGVADLKKALARLAVGEQVFWNSHPDQLKGFDLPPKATREEIEQAAKDARLDLYVRP